MGKIKVCLDAGHYGKYNQSPAVKSYYESDMNWKLHLKLKAELEKYGIEVITTRASQNVDRGLKERGKASQGCNLFLSIHSNATGSAVDNATDYPLVIVPLDGSGDALGNKLAKCIEDVMGTKQKGRIYERASESGNDWYGVIRGATIVGVPGLILEHSFHTHTTMAKWLLVDSNLDKLAVAEAKVIADYFGVKKPNNNASTGTASVKTYEAVVDLPIYSNAGDAKAKKSVRGTYAKGTYYIFNKYPDGVSGMLNITRDATGNAAGAWINPAENVVKVEEKKLYRVRKTWADENSQKGAFEDLTNAKTCCQTAGKGYSVFDWNGLAVYSYVAPVETPKEEKKIEVYDLAYTNKVKIVDLKKSFDNTELNRNCAKVIKHILSNNADFDIEIANVFFALAPKYGIDPMMAISQSILETGWFKYSGSAVTAAQHNYCGLGVTSNGVKGCEFDTIENGVRAQLQHLYAYGCKDSLPSGETTIVDPRFKYVTRGIAPYWQNLAGRWAVPGYDNKTYATPEDAMKAEQTYGQKIIVICNALNANTDNDNHIDNVKNEPDVKDVEDVVVEDVVAERPKENVSKFVKIIETILKTIAHLWKNARG